MSEEARPRPHVCSTGALCLATLTPGGGGGDLATSMATWLSSSLRNENGKLKIFNSCSYVLLQLCIAVQVGFAGAPLNFVATLLWLRSPPSLPAQSIAKTTETSLKNFVCFELLLVKQSVFKMARHMLSFSPGGSLPFSFSRYSPCHAETCFFASLCSQCHAETCFFASPCSQCHAETCFFASLCSQCHAETCFFASPCSQCPSFNALPVDLRVRFAGGPPSKLLQL